MRRPPLKALLFVALAVPLSDLSACTSSSGTSSDDLNPPRLRIDSIDSAGGISWTRANPDACIRSGKDPRKTLSVNVGPLDASGHLVSPGSQPISWTLSPPFSCSGTPPCGYLILTVCNSQVTTCNSLTDVGETRVADGGTVHDAIHLVASGPSIAVPMTYFANPVGAFTFHVELWDELQTPFKNDENGTLTPDDSQKALSSSEAVIQVTADCEGRPTPPDSGTAPPDAAIPDGAVIGPETGTPTPDSSMPAPDSGTGRDSGGPPPDAAVDAANPMDAKPPVDGSPTPTDSASVVPPVDAHQD